ncbi:hypothetical protein BDW02DRAFT_573019 [Decorospora gaudefroyi]|uniref:Uncharacterized protein n=1 Tax=Decorospora gaudefroyi TaxID=184978 RepID=A0A6A5K117_9PLEO|nr:hypothetical protein BDW02DRAFT_573019 [Decorospora gaudefroyi]
MLQSVNPSTRTLSAVSDFPATGLGLKIWVTLTALLLPLALLVAIQRYRKMQQQARKPFPFLKLPQELRDMVYEYLIEDPIYPPPPARQHQRSALGWMKPGRWTCTSITASAQRRVSTSIFLVNKQIYTEYTDMLFKRTTFHLSISPETYKPPTPSSLPDTDDHDRVWNLAPSTLSKIRTCSLKLITTSSMLGVTDPRAMTSSSWTLGQRIRNQLKHMSSIKSFTLDAKALGDPLWNPLWIWYHASQSFKLLGTDLSDTVPVGPRLSKITFSLDTWSPGENYLERDEQGGGEWVWYCMKGHAVGSDIGAQMTVREFCASLYRECKVCRGDEDGEQ